MTAALPDLSFHPAWHAQLELAYARAALKKLERLANADPAALAAARARLSAAERALTEHGTE